MTVHKDPACGCCEACVEHVRSAGYEAGGVIEIPAINAVKAKPACTSSCHTAKIDGYILVGHVRASAIARPLAERQGFGLAVTGMPIGSPVWRSKGAMARATR